MEGGLKPQAALLCCFIMEKLPQNMLDFIETNAGADVAALRLRYAGKSLGFDLDEALTQIECRRRYNRKLADTLASFPDFYFPTILAGEQSSSDRLAAWHASFVAEGLPAADLTAGLGIDVLHAAARASSVVAVEQQLSLADALGFNARGLSVDNIEVVNGDCRAFVADCIASGRRFATVFIDPARRAADGGRIYALADCSPDVTVMMPDLAKICDLLIIKASPMLDIAHTISAVEPRPRAVVASGTPTECKEVVVLVDFAGKPVGETLVEAVTLHADGRVDKFSFLRSAENEAPFVVGERAVAVGDYICEPSPALMKAGALKLLARAYGLMCFTPNTRLLYGAAVPDGFPGTTYRVEEVLPYASSVIKRFSRRWPVAEVAVRNFDIGADELRCRLGVRDGRDGVRVYGIKDGRNRPMLIVCR